MPEAVLYLSRDDIAIIAINRSERRNALGAAVRQGIRDGFERFEADPALRLAILTAVGDQAFCTGMDPKDAADCRALAHRRRAISVNSISVTYP